MAVIVADYRRRLWLRIGNSINQRIDRNHCLVRLGHWVSNSYRKLTGRFRRRTLAIIQLPKTPSAVQLERRDVSFSSGVPSALSALENAPIVPAGGGGGDSSASSGGLLSTVSGLLQQLLDISANAAATIQAFGPQNALQVTPVTFQSIEQEGRWKPPGILDPSSDGRAFELQQQATYYGQIGNQSGPQVLAEPYGPPKFYSVPVLKLVCESFPTTLPSQVVITATYWADGLEIWSGFCGMSQAQGFESVFNDMASISFAAVPFGNYYPAQVLITWAGWFNPVGKKYADFKGGIVLSADGGKPPNNNSYAPPKPCYMVAWDRDGSAVEIDNWNDKDGFVLSLNSASTGA
jgi:hypothetical protein